MAYLFLQTITQFAPLRTAARIMVIPHVDIIHDSFPKALFHEEEHKTNRLFFEIAWSFLSKPHNAIFTGKTWYCSDIQHRIGGLPAKLQKNLTMYMRNGKQHRIDKDPRTGLTLPAEIYYSGSREWYKEGEHHRDDKDPRTGLTLPAIIRADGSREWYKNGKLHRVDKDPRTGLTLPGAIYHGNSQYWYENGKHHRIDKDPETGLTLPAVISVNEKIWYKDGKIYRNEFDPVTGIALPAKISGTRVIFEQPR